MPQTKFLLDESDIPKHWYNVVADMPNPPTPPLGPDGKPIGPEALTPIFPMALIESAGFPSQNRCAKPCVCTVPHR
jgi:tryptophan synthase beta chain